MILLKNLNQRRKVDNASSCRHAGKKYQSAGFPPYNGATSLMWVANILSINLRAASIDFLLCEGRFQNRKLPQG